MPPQFLFIAAPESLPHPGVLGACLANSQNFPTLPSKTEICDSKICFSRYYLQQSAYLLSPNPAGPCWNFFPELGRATWQPEVIAIPLESAAPFLAFSLAWEGEAGHWQARFSADGQEWSPWQALHPDAHAEQRPQRRISELFYAEANSRYVELKSEMPVSRVEAHFL
jgi:hypothetical protein